MTILAATIVQKQAFAMHPGPTPTNGVFIMRACVFIMRGVMREVMRGGKSCARSYARYVRARWGCC